ncbi:LysR family transcriptional regulator [uncultured Sphingomonas sp.]|uniref:LysR family transcriptional regulator n=1 Tax=uncultured Sphingomonas sp. TaxID=158754 RepID=UPI0035CB5B21
MNINLKLLQGFLLVAEHSSFRSAALAANRSQSAISTQIKQLEEQLGVTLFHRTTRSVRLTDEGAQLIDSVRRALHEIESGLRKIGELVDLRSGHVSLGCSPTVAGTKLPFILADFGRSYPDVKLFVQELTSDALYQSIRQREVDFGIGPPCDEPDLICRTFLEEELYALVPQHLYNAQAPTIPLCDLVRMPVLLLNPATALRSIIEQTVMEQGLSLSTNYQFRQTQTLITAATAGLGTAILPKIAVPERVTPDLQVLRIVDPVMTRSIGIISLRGYALSPAATKLAAMVPRIAGPPTDRRSRRAVG